MKKDYYVSPYARYNRMPSAGEILSLIFDGILLVALGAAVMGLYAIML